MAATHATPAPRLLPVAANLALAAGVACEEPLGRAHVRRRPVRTSLGCVGIPPARCILGVKAALSIKIRIRVGSGDRVYVIPQRHGHAARGRLTRQFPNFTHDESVTGRSTLSRTV